MGPPLSPRAQTRHLGRRPAHSIPTITSESPDPLAPELAMSRRVPSTRRAPPNNEPNGRTKRPRLGSINDTVPRKNARSNDSSNHPNSNSRLKLERKCKEKEKPPSTDQLVEASDEDEQGITRCICGSIEDDHHSEAAEFMIQCEGCYVWQHGRCMGFKSEDELAAATDYYCEQCKPEHHQDLLRRIASHIVNVSHMNMENAHDGERSNSGIPDLGRTLQKFRHELWIANQKEDSLNKTIGSLEQTVQQLRTQLAESLQMKDDLLRVHEQKHHYEALYAAGRTFDAASSLVEIMNGMGENVRANGFLMNWFTESTSRCTSTLEKMGDDALNASKHDEALAAYSAALSLGPPVPDDMLIKWASTLTIHGSVNEALHAAINFKIPKSMTYQAICDVLEQDGRIIEAISCFQQMQGELAEKANTCDERAQWELGFQRRCAEGLAKFVDVAMDNEKFDEAAEHLSIMLCLDGVDRIDIFIRRSSARASMNLWADALRDADEVIKLDPSSHRAYERQHAALHGAKRHRQAVEAFDKMLLKLDGSPHQDIRKLRSQYTDARPTIRRIVNQTLRHIPRVLIDTVTGRLYDKNQQAAAFEAQPIWNELVSSMTRELDYPRIENAVKEFYRYVMLSHTWEDEEPLLHKVKDASVYELEPFPTNVKIQKFCKLVHSLNFHWAWADTTCVDQENNVVLQESLIAMFTWYRGSSLTLIYLQGVSSESQVPGGLRGSRWNTRGWTYQEYVAAGTVQFYVEDWTPYLGLGLMNHKESPAVVSEMQQATGVSAQEMAILRPGLDRVREKLYVASMRQTTRTEDVAYSLLGIFNVAIPVIYGEGDRAVGRLLEHVLTGSGDVTILAWTGQAGIYNSCLPVDLKVYNELMPPHIPQSINVVEMDTMIRELRSSLPDVSLAVMLHAQLKSLPSPSLASSRLRLAGVVCSVTKLDPISTADPARRLHVYRATAPLLGNIEIKTTDELTGIGDLCLIHPWIRSLMDQEYSRRGSDACAPDKSTQALRFVARLRQPFGALLLESVSPVEYRRVAADSLIMVQFCEEVSLSELMESVCTVEIQ